MKSILTIVCLPSQVCVKVTFFQIFKNVFHLFMPYFHGNPWVPGFPFLLKILNVKVFQDISVNNFTLQ